IFQTPDLQWMSSRPIGDLLRYRAESWTDFDSGPQRRLPGLQVYTALPPDRNPRTAELAAQMLAQARAEAGGGDATAALVALALQRLRTGGYSYTLEPGVYGDETADEFWFDHKAGFCEHIASAFVVL